MKKKLFKYRMVQKSELQENKEPLKIPIIGIKYERT